MPRSFDLSAESSASVEQVHSAFSNEGYWRARLAAFDTSVAVHGAPLSAVGAVLLAPVRNGSRVQYTATVEVKVPLVGGAIESFIGGQLAEVIIAIQTLHHGWIAENG
jgi:hypothetical protein